MHCFKSAILFAAATLGAALPAVAQTNGNRLITVTAERQAETTSYTGLGSLNFVSYKVTVANVGGNVVNNVSVRATSRVLQSGATDMLPIVTAPPAAGDWPAADPVLAPFNSSTSPACDGGTGTEANVVNCTVGQLRAAGQASSSATFVVWFASPTRTAAPPAEEKINLQWAASYSDASGGQRIDADAGIADLPTSIDPYGRLTNEFKSAVPPGGATLSTGSLNGDGLPTLEDPWTTTVVLPGAVSAFQQARGTERFDGILESSDLIDRRIVELVIPDTNYFPNKIVITLRRDFSKIRKGSKISNSVIYYTKTIATEGNDVPLPTDRVEVLFCTSGRVKESPPCISPGGRTATPARKVVNGKSEGYWQWVIEAFENGRYIN